MNDENKPSEPGVPEASRPEEQTAPPTLPPEASVTAPPPAPVNMEKWLWVDPYSTDEELKLRLNTGSVLLAEDIVNYISNYNVLVNKEDFELGKQIGAKLKGASYTMTPDEDGAWIYSPPKPNAESQQETILPKNDDVGPYYLIPKNSLVYVKIKQRLRIPFYIIGRHNLKIRYVYQGLLLGTGPQVDPGFRGHLFIPLHNFTTSDVKLYIKQSFISIDFTRTTELSFKDQAAPNSLDEFYSRFEKEKHLIERAKVEDRVTISKYLEGARPRSQMGQFQYDFEALEEKVKLEFSKLEETKRQLKWERIAVYVALISFLIGIGSCIYASLSYYRGFVADFKSETERVRSLASNTNIASFESRLLNLESNAEVIQIANTNLIRSEVSSQVASQQDQIKNMIMSQEEINVLNKLYERYQTNAMSGSVK